MNVPGIKSNDAQELYRFSQNVKQGFVPGSDGAYNTIQTPIVVSTVIAFDTVFANRAVLNFVDFTAGEGGQIVVSWRGVLSNSGATPATQLRVGLEISDDGGSVFTTLDTFFMGIPQDRIPASWKQTFETEIYTRYRVRATGYNLAALDPASTGSTFERHSLLVAGNIAEA